VSPFWDNEDRNTQTSPAVNNLKPPPRVKLNKSHTIRVFGEGWDDRAKYDDRCLSFILAHFGRFFSFYIGSFSCVGSEKR